LPRVDNPAAGDKKMENDWDAVRNGRGWTGGAGLGILRVTLLFASAAVALALIIAPIAERQTRSDFARNAMPAGLDEMTTGSTGYRGEYTIRKSVLQSSPQTVCVIRDNGVRIGDC
jgi:hypothetical protein